MSVRSVDIHTKTEHRVNGSTEIEMRLRLIVYPVCLNPSGIHLVTIEKQIIINKQIQKYKYKFRKKKNRTTLVRDVCNGDNIVTRFAGHHPVQYYCYSRTDFGEG